MKSVVLQLAFAALGGAASSKKGLCIVPDCVGTHCDEFEGSRLVQKKQKPASMHVQEVTNDPSNGRKQTPISLQVEEDADAPHSGCQNCCNDGQKVVPCLDVDACAANGPQQGKYALVFSYTGKPPQKFFPNILHVRKHAKWADFILLMTEEDAKLLDEWQLRTMYLNDVKLRTVDWAVPPNMLHSSTIPKGEVWCGDRKSVV